MSKTSILINLWHVEIVEVCLSSFSSCVRLEEIMSTSKISSMNSP